MLLSDIIDRAVVKAKAAAKAITALVVPVAATAGFELLDEVAAMDLPPVWRLVLTGVLASLAVYRVPNAKTEG